MAISRVPERRVLSNGLTILHRQVPNSLTFGVIVSSRIGARHEKPEQHGLTHLCEHVIFTGAQNLKSQVAVKDEIQRLGDQTNADTSKDHVRAYGKFAAKDAQRGFDLIAGVFLSPLFPPDGFEQERGIVLNEIRQSEDNPMRASWSGAGSIFWDGGMRHQVLGESEDVSALTVRQAREWWGEEVIKAANVVVATYGPMDIDKIEKMLTPYLPFLPRGTRVTTEVCKQNVGARAFKGKKIEQNYLMMLYPGREVADLDYYKSDVLASMLGGSMNSVLFTHVRERLQAAYSVFACNDGFEKEGIFLIGAVHDPKKEAEKLIREIIADLRTYLTNKNFKSTIDSSIAGLCINSDSPSSLIDEDFKREVLGAPNKSPEERIAQFEKLTLVDIIEESEQIFSVEPTIHVLGPERG